MPNLLLKYWKPLVLVALLAAVIGGVYGYGHTRYKEGVRDTEAKQAAAVQKQTEEVLNKERQANTRLAEAQAQVEKEREHAKTTIADLRTELGRVRQTADAHRRTLSAGGAAAGTPDGQDAARGWQLFGYCSERLSGLAEVADEQRNDLAEWQAYGRVVADTANK